MNNKKQKSLVRHDGTGLFWQFVKLCLEITEESKYTLKTQILKDFLESFTGDIYLLFKLLLPKQDKRVFRLQDKALVQVMSQVLGADHDDMLEHLDKGDASETCKKFLISCGMACKRGSVSLKQVDDFLDQLTTVTKRDEQAQIFEKFIPKLTGDEMKYLARLILGDLKIYAGHTYILPALHPDALKAFNVNSDLKYIVDLVVHNKNGDLSQLSQSLNQSADIDIDDVLAQRSDEDEKSKKKKKVDKKLEKKPMKLADLMSDEDDGSGNDDEEGLDLADIIDKPVDEEFEEDEDIMVSGSKKRKKKNQLGTAAKKLKITAKMKLFNPIKPMLARASKTFDDTINRCPNGFYVELKYDGERIQIHFDRSLKKLSCFSRNLKPVMEYKVQAVEKYIAKAINPNINKVILDGEILLVDTKTGEPLPFGTLGKHKKNQFTHASVCIYLFDILYYEGKSLLHIPLNKRRQLMIKSVTPIDHKILIGESFVCNGSLTNRGALLAAKMQKVIEAGQEGLVVKDLLSIYEPNARHWLKIKKDYLKGMADSADLLVLGAYYGTGSKGGLMSVFLMGVYDEKSGEYKTVCKCGNGHDDDTIEQINDDMKGLMVKISKDYDKVPSWLDIDRSLVPDFIVKDPKKTVVWEISGAEFSITKKHTANVSIRFPRVTRVRDDKDPGDATTLKELMILVKASSKKDPVALEESIKVANTVTKKKKQGKASTSKSAMNDDSDVDKSEDEEEEKPKPKQKKDKPTKKKEKKMGEDIKDDDEVAGEPADLDYVYAFITKLTGTGDKMIVHSVDDSGRWSQKGTMGMVSSTYGSTAEDLYKNQQNGYELGTIQASEIDTKDDNKLYVCNMIAQEFQKRSEAPTVNMKAFEVCLHRIRMFIIRESKETKRKPMSVHFSRLHHAIPGLDWSSCEELIKECLTTKGVHTVVYTRDRDDKSRVEATKQRRKAQVKSVPTKVEKVTESTDMPEDKMVDDNDHEVQSDDETDDDLGLELDQQKTNGLFSSVSAVISGYDEETYDEIAGLIKKNGGLVKNFWSYVGAERSTHLICEQNNDMFEHVNELDEITVTKGWVLDCVKENKLLDIEPYIYRGTATTSTLPVTQTAKSEIVEKRIAVVTETETVQQGSQNEASQKLLDVFNNCTVMLFGDVNKRRVVKRYLVAYNADVVDEFDEDLVTHIVTDNTTWNKALDKYKKLGTVKIVRSSWVWQSVNEEKKADERSHFMK